MFSLKLFKSQTGASSEVTAVPESSLQDQAQENGQPKRGLSEAARWRLTLCFALAIPVFLETLDYTVVATAQTRIASIFNRLDLQSYIGTAYLLTSTVFLPLFASVADIWGRHASLQVSLILFIFGSALSTGARNMAMMLVGRGIAGIGAAGLLTAPRVILIDSRSLEDTNWQTSILFFLYGIGYSVGPVIGGFLITASFRWVFAINLPGCVLAMVIAFFTLRGKVKGGLSSDQRSRWTKFLLVDWVGAFMFAGAGILILLALNWGSTERWDSAKVIVSFCLGGFLFILCILWEYYLERIHKRKSNEAIMLAFPEPMIPLEIFKSYDVCATSIGAFASGMVTLVMFYFVAIFLIVVRDLTPAKSGAQLVFFAPGLGAGTLISIRLIARFKQPRYPIIASGIITTVSLGLISFSMHRNNQKMVNGFLAMAGVGVGLSIAALAIQARFALAANRAAIVTALQIFWRNFGGTIGLAQCATVLSAKVRAYIVSKVASGALPLSDVASLSLTTGLTSLDNIKRLPPDVQAVVRDAFREGVRWAFISLIPWMALATIVTFFLSDIQDETGKGKASAVEPAGETKIVEADTVVDPEA